jgi:mono/diheme cytochrome c family protein
MAHRLGEGEAIRDGRAAGTQASTRRGPSRLVWAALGLGSALWLGTLAAQAAPSQQDVPRPGVPPRAGGAYWFNRYCAACHGPQGEGTLIGPRLAGRPDGPLSYETILYRVRQPLLLMPDFPPELVPDERVREIADYLASLHSAP